MEKRLALGQNTNFYEMVRYFQHQTNFHAYPTTNIRTVPRKLKKLQSSEKENHICHDNVLYAVFTVCCECTVQVLLLSALLKVLKGDSHLFYFNKISSDLTMAMSTSIQC